MRQWPRANPYRSFHPPEEWEWNDRYGFPANVNVYPGTVGRTVGTRSWSWADPHADGAHGR